MAIQNGYLTTDEAREYAGLSDLANTELLDDVVTAVSRLIDQACQRTFWQTAVDTARLFPTTSSNVLEFGEFNDAAAVTEIAVDRDGDGTFEEVISASNYVLEPVEPSAAPEARPYTCVRLLNNVYWPGVGGSAISGRTHLIRVTGTWGWPAVPAMVKQACRLQTARVLKRQESSLGVAGFGEFGVVRVSRIDPDIDSMLQPYKLLSPGIA